MQVFSFAVWPEGQVSTGRKDRTSMDGHGESLELAFNVCDSLRRSGLGGERKIYPESTRVSYGFDVGDLITFDAPPDFLHDYRRLFEHVEDQIYRVTSRSINYLLKPNHTGKYPFEFTDHPDVKIIS